MYNVCLFYTFIKTPVSALSQGVFFFYDLNVSQWCNFLILKSPVSIVLNKKWIFNKGKEGKKIMENWKRCEFAESKITVGFITKPGVDPIIFKTETVDEFDYIFTYLIRLYKKNMYFFVEFTE